MKGVTLKEFLSGFSDSLDAADLFASRLIGKISAAIFKKRLDLKMSQSQFAELLDVSQPMVSKMESGDYNYSVEKLAEIFTKLDMDIDIRITDYHYSNDYLTYLPDIWCDTGVDGPGDTISDENGLVGAA